MIRIEHIRKSFAENEVLRGISATFHQGKTNLIIGRSGAGKTVLLKILVGLLQPDKGDVWYGDIHFNSLKTRELRTIRMEVGMLFQGSALFDFMTVEENIRFPLDMFTTKTQAEKLHRVNEVLERVGLSGVNHQYPSEVSGGMQKRVGIARAIVFNPKYLFCDEPNSGLDPKTSLVIDELIQEITREYNMTTVINTHDMNSVMEIGENISLLYQGELVWQGSKDEVVESDNDILNDFIFASPFLQRLKTAALDRGKLP